jgi:hypothetical protein
MRCHLPSLVSDSYAIPEGSRRAHYKPRMFGWGRARQAAGFIMSSLPSVKLRNMRLAGCINISRSILRRTTSTRSRTIDLLRAHRLRASSPFRSVYIACFTTSGIAVTVPALCTISTRRAASILNPSVYCTRFTMPGIVLPLNRAYLLSKGAVFRRQDYPVLLDLRHFEPFAFVKILKE